MFISHRKKQRHPGESLYFSGLKARARKHILSFRLSLKWSLAVSRSQEKAAEPARGSSIATGNFQLPIWKKPRADPRSELYRISYRKKIWKIIFFKKVIIAKQTEIQSWARRKKNTIMATQVEGGGKRRRGFPIGHMRAFRGRQHQRCFPC